MYFAALWCQQGLALVGDVADVLLLDEVNTGGTAAANAAADDLTELGLLDALVLGPLERGRTFFLVSVSTAGAAGVSVCND